MSSTPSRTWSSPFDTALESFQAQSPSPISTPEPVIGTPNDDSLNWAGPQHFQDTCAIRCQEFLITQFTGQDPGEAHLIKEAAAHGWYHPGSGTSVEDVGNLLEAHGISVNRYHHASIFHLGNELAQGHKVIVGVHSEGLWQQHPILDEISGKLRLNHADHAVVVSGIDTSDPEHHKVIISDPGTGEALARYPLEQFLHAWKDGDFFMVATKEPPPPSAHLPEMAHFDYNLGHIDTVLGQSYDDFHALAATPSKFEEVLLKLIDVFVPHTSDLFLQGDHSAAPRSDAADIAFHDHGGPANFDGPSFIDPAHHHTGQAHRDASDTLLNWDHDQS